MINNNHSNKESGNYTELSTTDLSTLYHKPILNREEASLFLGVSIRHIDNLIKRMDIPFSKSGRRTLLRRVDIDKYVETNNTAGGIVV